MYTYIDVFNQGKFLQFDELSTELNIPGTSIQLEALQVNKPSQVCHNASSKIDPR